MCEMARMLRIAWSIALGMACSSPCELERLAECADCGPGEIRGGVRAPMRDVLASPPRSVALGDGGVGCVACDALHLLDRGGSVRGAIDLDDPDALAVASSGEIYVLHNDQIDEGSEEIPRDNWELVALDAAGDRRWRVALGEYPTPIEVFAGPEGPYVTTKRLNERTLTAYAAADGAVRWTLPGHGGVPDNAGGAFVLTWAYGEPSVTGAITLVDRAGVVRWTQTLTARSAVPNRGGANVEVRALYPTAGGVAVAGVFTGYSLDVGGVQVMTPDDLYTGFVASLDASGAARWVHALDVGYFFRDLVVTAIGDRVILGGTYVGGGGALELPDTANALWSEDGFVALIDSTGPVRVHHVGGDDFQSVTAIQAADNGTVWATIDTEATHGGGTRELVLGARTFESDGSARRYLVNLEP
jgi:hypothetical protein